MIFSFPIFIINIYSLENILFNDFVNLYLEFTENM